MKKLKYWLFAIAIAIFSALLVAFAYDIEHGISIGLSSTNAGKQELLMALAGFLGLKGSLIVGLLTTGVGLYNAIVQHRNK